MGCHPSPSVPDLQPVRSGLGQSGEGLDSARSAWNVPGKRLALICSQVDDDDVEALAHEAARLRRENQALRGEPATADAIDVLSGLFDVERDADMFVWMPQGWSPSYLATDSESD